MNLLKQKITIIFEDADEVTSVSFESGNGISGNEQFRCWLNNTWKVLGFNFLTRQEDVE